MTEKHSGRENISITVTGRGAAENFEYDGQISLMEALQRQNIYISASCAGRGTCGKCTIQVIEGELTITPQDQKKLTEAELSQGYRLSCAAYPKADCTIRIIAGDETDFEVVTENGQEKSFGLVKEANYSIAIDIGTTTIAVSLIGGSSKQVIKTYATINRQRAYGADVISRINASNEGKKELLQDSIRKDLLEGIKSLVVETGVAKDQIQQIAIAGNTTMGHLLMGYSCENLGKYPFTPVNISTITGSFFEILGSDDLEAPVILLPGITTYVGADITAGLLACDIDQKEKPCLLIDLGTNGEMAIGCKDKILVSSTAAGPAFEGGNISCGVGSIAGAICSFEIRENQLSFQTIGDKAPVGICGTGVIELTSELVKAGYVDETGLLCDDYFEEGYLVGNNADQNPIIFSQRDIREIQLAKSAIRAGVETLLIHYGIGYDDVDTVYLAGGFGYKINLEKATQIGLLPAELSKKMKAVGNSSLSGAMKYLLEEDAPKRTERIVELSTEISLSNDKNFNELYIEHMYF